MNFNKNEKKKIENLFFSSRFSDGVPLSLIFQTAKKNCRFYKFDLGYSRIKAFDFDAIVSEMDPRWGRIKKYSIFYWEYFWAISSWIKCAESSAHRTWFAFADDPCGWATSKLCQVTRLPMRSCQWSEDENWEWTTTRGKSHAFF